MNLIEDALVVRLQGEIDMGVSETLRVRIDKELDRQRAKHLVFSLRGVGFIDSSGLGLILGRYKKVTAQGGKVVLSGANASVDRILDLSGLYKVMRGFAAESEAVRALKGGASTS